MKVTSEMQWRFARMLQLLVGYAELLGYRVTYGEVYRPPGLYKKNKKGKWVRHGHRNSLHGYRLAVDVNLFKKINGKWTYQDSTKAHRKLGKFWQFLGGAWGGSDGKDGNHYSWVPPGSNMKY